MEVILNFLNSVLTMESAQEKIENRQPSE